MEEEKENGWQKLQKRKKKRSYWKTLRQNFQFLYLPIHTYIHRLKNNGNKRMNETIWSWIS